MKRLVGLFTVLAATMVMAADFSVSPVCKVSFAPGNLQYQASTNTFRFAPEQYTVLGYTNDSIGADKSEWMDLFGWATSGYKNTDNDRLAIHYQPWSWICELGAELDYENNQFGYGPSQYMPDRNMEGTAANYDWGHYCTIGGDKPGTWRTMSREEWRYLLYGRDNAAGLQQRVTVVGIHGLMLYPDDYQGKKAAAAMNGGQWKKFQKQGCVFLPMAGARYHYRTADVNEMGSYWTSTCHNQASSYFVGIYREYVSLSTELYGRHTGRCVRLVKNVTEPGQPMRSTVDEEEFRYVDAAQFRIINQAFAGRTLTQYTRFPLSLKKHVSTEFWHRETNSAGIAIRFRTNSVRIAARYVLRDNFRMRHMADTGVRGTDLYILGEDGKWKYVNTARPIDQDIQHKVYTENNDGKMHEYMLYLPLYDGINWLQIGVDYAATITSPEVNTPREQKIVFYGTSILQGGCASRPGMVATSIIQRELDYECPNLAISGEGRIHLDVARALASADDVIAYVLDPVPNSTLGVVDTLAIPFVRIIREAHPDVPIIMVGGPSTCYAPFDQMVKDAPSTETLSWQKAYMQLSEKDPNLYYVSEEGLAGLECSGTVDAIHLTDLGFRAYADKLERSLREILRR